MRVLVTGGAGFIGSNLVRALLGAGHEVAVVDDLSTGSPANLDPRTAFRTMDILAPEFPAYLAQSAPEVVVHLAAQSSVAESVRDPKRDHEVNAEGTRLVAKAAREAGVRRVLTASSAAVYGEPAELPLTESSPTEPINPYGSSKLEAESLLAEELDGSGVDYASLRFANVYGPRQDAKGEGGVVAIFLGRVRNGEPPVVHGTGKQTRDFIYVGDLVAALLIAIEFEGSLAEQGSVYNISTGEPSSVEQLVGAIRQATAYFGPVEHQSPREGDIEHSLLAPAKAQRVLGWRAGVPLETGVALTWRWLSSQA
jgi:UDP-glucose 4-epimerase